MAASVRNVTAESELAGFLAKFTPEMQERIRACRAKVSALIEAALGLAATPMDVAEGPELIIQSVSAKQRPRQ